MKNSAVDAELTGRVKDRLSRIYPDHDLEPLTSEALALFSTGDAPPVPVSLPLNYPASAWSEKDMILITYGNSIVDPETRPLTTLLEFLDRYMPGLFSIVHILPFFPFSSDDGFAVMDYYSVNPALGSWEDLREISRRYRLMADLVINHTSSRCGWFENFKKGEDPGQDYYLTEDPASDLSRVIRPRTSPLLRPVQTPAGIRHVWCTFSHDQVDLDFKNPRVLMEFLAIVRYYMDRGVQVFRLDAVAFLWKEACTPCLHLSQTHEIIKLLRTLIQAKDPRALIITETNVPSLENLSYLGNGDEAHVIYNFPLPPFLVNTLVTGDSRLINNWLQDLPETPPGTTYLNFIASHDGIGLRPVEGYFTDLDLDRLITCMQTFGAGISTRALNNSAANPYEINISLWDALKGTVEGGPDRFHLERFICAHAIMLCLKGIPAFYIHSLLGTENDDQRRKALGSNRAVNRHIWDYGILMDRLEDPASHHHQVLYRLIQLSAIRKAQPAFHPDAGQRIFAPDRRLVVVLRTANSSSHQESQTILCIHNISDQEVRFLPGEMTPSGHDCCKDLTGEQSIDPSKTISLAPYDWIWLQFSK